MSRAYDRGNVPTSVARLDRGYLPLFSLYDSHAGMFREGNGKIYCLRPRLTIIARDRGHWPTSDAHLVPHCPRLPAATAATGLRQQPRLRPRH